MMSKQEVPSHSRTIGPASTLPTSTFVGGGIQLVYGASKAEEVRCQREVWTANDASTNISGCS
jgi:hypothetical protein